MPIIDLNVAHSFANFVRLPMQFQLLDRLMAQLFFGAATNDDRGEIRGSRFAYNALKC